MVSLWQDIRYGFRMLVRNPGFTVVVVVILALGIGANTAIFSIVNAVLLRPLPFENPDRIVQILTHVPKLGRTLSKTSFLDFVEIRERNRVFEQVAAIKSQDFVDIGGDEPLSVQGARVPAGFFSLLGVRPMLGRGFRQEEDQSGKDNVMVLSNRFWKQHYGADPGIIGRNIRCKEGTYVVIGILPPDFRFLEYRDVWKPLALTEEQVTDRNEINAFRSLLVGRLKSDVTLEQAQAELDVISSQLGQQYPRHIVRSFLPIRLRSRLVANVRHALWVLLGTVGLVLIIACANVANMLLARFIGRQREVAIRTALGAGRLRLIRQFLTESLMLSLAGGLCALLLAFCSIDLIKLSLPSDIPRLSEIRIDGWVLCFALLVSILTGATIGLTPALRLREMGVSRTLKEGGFTVGNGTRRNRLHRILLVSEVALSLMLLIGAGLMIKGFWRLTSIDLGFNPKNLLYLKVAPEESIYAQPGPYFRTLNDRIGQLSDVQTVAFGCLRLFGTAVGNDFGIAGRDISVDGEKPNADFINISEHYFTALRIPLLMGRYFVGDDRSDTDPSVIINQTIAQHYFPDGSPLGQALICGGKSCWIVGVVGDVHPNGFRSDVIPTIYFPLLQNHWGQTDPHLIVRTHGAPEASFESIRRELLRLNPLHPVERIRTFKEILAEQVAPMRLNTQLLSLFAVVSLVLASAGIYGLMAFFVSQRTHEIGIRMALGAECSDVFKLVIKKGLILIVVGLVIGVGGALALTRVLRSLLYGLSPSDLMTFVAVSLLLIVVGLVACYIPARRATKIDPVRALRYE